MKPNFSSFLFIFTILILFSCSDSETDVPVFGTINENQVNFRKEPHLNSPVLSQFPQGTKIRILGRSMIKQKVKDAPGYWYKTFSEGETGWVWGQFIDFPSEEYKEDGVLKLTKENDFFILRFTTSKNVYFQKFRELDVAQSQNYYILYTKTFENPRPNIWKFIDNGICLFKKDGTLINFLQDESPFHFPEDSISPSEAYFAVSYGTAGIGRALGVFTLDNLKITANLGQANSKILWVDNETLLFSDIDDNQKMRNWQSEDSYFIGIKIFHVNTLQEKWVIPPTASSNFYLDNISEGNLFYIERKEPEENPNSSSKGPIHKIALKDLIK